MFGAVILVGAFYWLGRAFIDEPSRFGEVTLIGFTNGSIYALIALGYTLVYGIIELINFAHGDNFTLGTFQTKSIVTDGAFQIPLVFGVVGIPLGTAAVAEEGGWGAAYAVAAAVFMSMLFCMVVNVSIERFAYKPLRNQPRLAPLITAIGFSFILQNVGLLWLGGSQVGVPDLVRAREELFTIGGVRFEHADALALGLTIPLVLLLTSFVTQSRLGKAMRATAQDPEAARLMGINVDNTISLTFLLGGLLAGAGGLIYALYQTNVWFFQGFRAGLFAFTAAVMGGIGNLRGAVLGGFIIGIIQQIADNRVIIGGQGGGEWTPVIVFGYLILIMTFRPQGLLGEETREAG